MYLELVPITMRAAIYCRISQDRAGAGLGVKRQLKDCRELAARLGWAVVEVYTDNDTSAYSGKPRKGYQRMLADIEAGRINAVLVWHNDRLHRAPIELEYFIALIESKRVQIQTVQNGELDLSTPSGQMAARQVGSVAAYESKHKSARARRKALELAQGGSERTGGTRPWGFEPDRITVRKSEARVIRDVMKRALRGESFGSLVAELNKQARVGASRDLAYFTPTGGPWRTTTLQRALCSARLAGWRSHNPGKTSGNNRLGGPFLVKGSWEPIVTRAQVERLRAKLADPDRKHQPARKYLLSNILICSYCQHGMLGSPSGHDGARRYRCVKVPDGRGCGKTFIRAEEVEHEIINLVKFALGDGIAERLVRAAGDLTEDDEELADQIAEQEATLVQLGADYDDKVIGRAEWLQRRERVQKRLEAARAQLAGHEAVVDLDGGFTSPETFDQAWVNASFERKRGVVQAVLFPIEVGPAVRGLNRFDSDRLGIRWKA